MRKTVYLRKKVACDRSHRNEERANVDRGGCGSLMRRWLPALQRKLILFKSFYKLILHTGGCQCDRLETPGKTREGNFGEGAYSRVTTTSVASSAKFSPQKADTAPLRLRCVFSAEPAARRAACTSLASPNPSLARLSASVTPSV